MPRWNQQQSHANQEAWRSLPVPGDRCKRSADLASASWAVLAGVRVGVAVCARVAAVIAMEFQWDAALLCTCHTGRRAGYSVAFIYTDKGVCHRTVFPSPVAVGASGPAREHRRAGMGEVRR